MEFGVKFTLTAPNGDVAVFNDSTDPNYVGVLNDVTGLDSPEIRENAADLVEFDGGIHGNFYFGRRPVVLTGLVYGHSSASARNAKLTTLQSAAKKLLRADGTLSWTPSGGVQQFINVRLNQPLRVTGAWNKDFQLPLVAADPRIYSYAINSLEVSAIAAEDLSGRSYDLTFDKDYGPATPNGQALVTNAGTGTTYPVFIITGPGTQPKLYNLTNGGLIALNYTLADGETMVIDTLNRTVKLGGTIDRYYAVDRALTSWFGLDDGLNDIRIAFSTFSSGAKLRVDWRDAWL